MNISVPHEAKPMNSATMKQSAVTQGAHKGYERNKAYEIKLVSHAFNVLEQFYGAESELGVSDLSRRTKLTKNKVFRLLSTLKSLNYIEQNRLSGNYRLSLKVSKLTQTGGRNLRNLTRLRTVMEAMVKECNETVCFSVPDHGEALILDVLEGSQVLQVIQSVGTRFPSHCSAAGKVFMAFMTGDQRATYLDETEMRQYTSNTIIDPLQLARQLQEVAAQGYALEREELEMGVVSVGAPVRDATGNVIGAVSLPGPVQRYGEERLRKHLIPVLLNGAADISAAMGFR